MFKCHLYLDTKKVVVIVIGITHDYIFHLTFFLNLHIIVFSSTRTTIVIFFLICSADERLWKRREKKICTHKTSAHSFLGYDGKTAN